MSISVDSNGGNKVSSDEFSISDICIVIAWIFAMISMIYSMYISANMHHIIMNKNLSDTLLAAKDSYVVSNVLIFSLLCLVFVSNKIKGNFSKFLAVSSVLIPFSYMVANEVYILSNQLVITHFRASSLYPNEANLTLFSELIKNLPNSPLSLLFEMKSYRAISPEGCKYLFKIMPPHGVYESAIGNLCKNNYSPNFTILKYIYLGIVSFSVALLIALISVSKYVGLLSNTTNK